MNATSNPSTTEKKYGKKKYKIVFTDHILDNLYGQIPITEVEKKIERLAIFKRLHNISQLGFTNLIFPCALHTRYVHSLGVMHTAYNMALHINMNQPGFFSEVELQIIRLAGMLHDIGHYPLSHNIEAAYKNTMNSKKDGKDIIENNLERLVGCPDFLHPDRDVRNTALEETETINKLQDKLSGSSLPHHEAVGACIIKNNKAILDVVQNEFIGHRVNGKFCVYSDFKTINGVATKPDPKQIAKDVLNTIASIITGNYEIGFLQPKYNYEKKYSAMVQLIHSEMDADNLDYLLRDATFSGTSYGVMDVNALLNSLVVSEVQYIITDVKLKDKVAEGEDVRRVFYVVGIKEKGIGCVDQYFQNKYLAYNQMIYSKYVSILEAMLLCWATQYFPQDDIYRFSSTGNISSEKEKQQVGLDALINSEDTKIEYLRFTDDYIKNALFQNFDIASKHERLKIAKISKLMNIILSNLTSYRALNLADKNSDVSCAGLGKEQIQEEMMKQPLYGEFVNDYKKARDHSVDEFYESDIGLKLFAYRFETYSLTRQLPWDEYKYREDTDLESIFKLYFYRFVEGVPIIKQKKYEFELKDKVVNKEKLPELIVDSSRSVLHSIYKQQFVSLRKYRMESYADAIK